MSGTLRTVTHPALEAVPGLVHGFEQRLGPAGWEERDDSRRRVAQALAGSGRLHLLKQVHGCRVQTAPWDGRPEADASVSDAAGLVLGIETADCQPILLVDPVNRRVAAAHAGWRGTAGGVARETVAAMVARGSRPADIVAVLGPSIGPDNYEVGPEFVARFVEADAENIGYFAPSVTSGHAMFDLNRYTVDRLARAGVIAEGLGRCTYAEEDLFYSYRRTTHRKEADYGRQVSAIVLENE